MLFFVSYSLYTAFYLVLLYNCDLANVLLKRHLIDLTYFTAGVCWLHVTLCHCKASQWDSRYNVCHWSVHATNCKPLKAFSYSNVIVTFTHLHLPTDLLIGISFQWDNMTTDRFTMQLTFQLSITTVQQLHLTCHRRGQISWVCDWWRGIGQDTLVRQYTNTHSSAWDKSLNYDMYHVIQ